MVTKFYEQNTCISNIHNRKFARFINSLLFQEISRPSLSLDDVIREEFNKTLVIFDTLQSGWIRRIPRVILQTRLTQRQSTSF